MLAAIKGDTALARKLIARGAYINMPGWTPLHYAASGGHVDILQMLLDQSAYIDAESPNKTTPLMMAARYGSPESVQLLLDAGADPTLRNELGLTALDFAERGARPDAIRMLTAALGAAQAKGPKGQW
jgi:ankyrin repeat protein